MPPSRAGAPDQLLPFLESDAPHWAARGLAYILLLLVATGVVVAAVLRLPETVTSPFVLLPARGMDPVKAWRGGRVAQVRVAEGQTVRQGEALVVIQSAVIGERFAELQTLETQLHGMEESLTNVARRYEGQRRAADEEDRRQQERLAYLRRTVAARQQELTLVQETVEMYKRLYDRGLASRLEYANRQLGANRVAVELDQAMTERAETRRALEKLRHEAAAGQAEYREQTRRLIEDREKARIRVTALHQELAQSRGNELLVLAPCAGTLLRLRVQGPGAVVQDGEVLGELACAGERLQAELLVPQDGVSRLTPGLRVKLLYAAFPYQRYGVRYGTLRWVSPSSVADQHPPVFRVLVDIDDEAVVVEGQARPLLAGMGGQAAAVVGRTSALSYAFGPLRQLKETFAVPPRRPAAAGAARAR
jgi:multidrug efflux pump subunit AcrA (membrane-fusion protein)